MDCTCHVCREVLPRELMQEHHIHPQAAGGKDKGTTWLCAGCHHNLHRISDMLVAGKNSKALDVAERANLGKPGAAKRIMALAAICAREMQMIKEGEADLPDLIQLTISDMPREAVVRLKLMAFEWNNSRPGLAPFLRHHLTALSEGRLDNSTKRVRRPEHAPDVDDEDGVVDLA